MSRLQLITLDLDNTLWDVEKTIRAAEQDLIIWLQTNAEPAHQIYVSNDLLELREQTLRQHPNLRHDLSRLRIEILSNVMRKAQYQEQEARNLAEAAFEVFFAGRNRVAFFPGALEMLKTLSERYPVYALTNGNADASRTGISPYLKGAISSALVGASKPDPSMFHAALNQAGTSAQYCVHIGDHLHDDIRGADAVGMHSIWVNLQQSERADSDPSPTREVNQLSDIAAAVTAIEASLSA
ncbi:MAG: HAD-IA family hydrolase [Pseudomonadota bacterium]|nr:HAD-IA family hydrolase [Pseudomonadota bacterium]MED5341367.1 HAD-IA family hydrolase [Pseudomonadota bacterium]